MQFNKLNEWWWRAFSTDITFGMRVMDEEAGQCKHTTNSSSNECFVMAFR